MSRIREASLLVILGSVVFCAAFLVRSKATAPVSGGSGDMNASRETKELAVLGNDAGRKLVAYVLLSPHCGYCALADTKHAVGRVRSTLEANDARSFQTIRVVGVIVDSDVEEGMTYARSFHAASFDEVNVGGGWRNDAIVRLVWRSKTADAAVPQIVLLAHSIAGQPNPLALTYGADSILTVVRGHREILDWVDKGAPLQWSPLQARKTSD